MHYSIDENKILYQLMTYLKDGKSPSFRYNKNCSCIRDFSEYIVYLIKVLKISNQNVEVIFSLIREHDYRLVALYLMAQKTKKQHLIKKFHLIASLKNKIEANKQKYSLAVAYMFPIGQSQKINISFTRYLDHITHTNHNEIKIYLFKKSYKDLLITLLHDINYRIGDYIEQQYDVQTLNALISQGIVKTWVMPNGQEVISKKNNPTKPKRFYREQNNHIIIQKKFNNKAILLAEDNINQKKIWLKVASPFAIIKEGISQIEYALSIKIEGTLLVDLFTQTINPLQKEKYLFHYRLILDALYDRGIIWGDMALRNIIVQEKEKSTIYYIFDFEKTQILDYAIPLIKRIEHCREQIFAEELCTICNLSEIAKYLSDYFNPSDWDFDSTENVTFPLRDEVLDIVSTKKGNYVPLGEYNRKDYAIIKMREVKINPLNGEKVFLGHLGFKVEHYLSCIGVINSRKYENLLTTVLIGFQDLPYYNKVINLLIELLDIIEYTFIKTEFQNIFQRKKRFSRNKNIIVLTNYLIFTLNTLYNIVSYNKENQN
jgi:hypothetical protein